MSCFMSLQRYLFLLIGALILVFSSIQFYFIEQVRLQVNEEITNKTQTISQVALSAITNNLPMGKLDQQNSTPAINQAKIPTIENSLANELNSRAAEHANKNEIKDATLIETLTPGKKAATVSIKIENTPNKEITLDEGLIMVTGDKTKTVTVSLNNDSRPQAPLHHDKAIINSQYSHGIPKAEIKALLVNRLNAAYTVDFTFVDNDQNFQKIVSFDNDTSSVNSYFSQLQWQLLGFTVVGLVFAFCLAKHISKPLSQLNKGFSDIGNGEFGVQLAPYGVKEMRDTIAIFNQTSERLNQLQSLEVKYMQQQQMAELGEVARGLAHTLRNPLNTIGLGVSQLQEASMSSDQKVNIAKQIQEKILHLDDTIKSLMHLANTDIDRSQMLNLVAVVSDIMLEVSVTSQARIEFPMALSKQCIELRCAEAEVRAMVHAIISNAIEANQQQDNEHPVSVSLTQSKKGILLSVTDFGEGISQVNSSELFKPHFTTKPEGAGMGLFIVKRISEMHYKGSIKLENHSAGGCIASLTLQHANGDLAHV